MSKLALMGFFAIMLAASNAVAGTDETKITVSPVPGDPLVAAEHAKGLTAIIDNLAKIVKQTENTDGRQQAWDQAKKNYDKQLAENNVMNANRNMRLAQATEHRKNNVANRSELLEFASLATSLGTVANTSMTQNYVETLYEQFDGKSRTSESMKTPVTLDLAVAEACQGGCVSEDEAQRFSSSGIQCHSDKDVAGSWTNPGLLRKLVDKEGCVSMKPSGKAAKCLGAFRHLMAIGNDFPSQDRGKSSPGRVDTIRIGLQKIASADASRCMTMQLKNDICLPKSAVSDAKSYQKRADAAEKMGVKCAKKIDGQGNLPSQNCANQVQMALARGQMINVSKEHDVSAKDSNAQHIAASGNAEMARQGAMAAQSAQTCDSAVAQGQLERSLAYLDRPEVKAYIASAEFPKNVAIAQANIPEVTKKVEVAMNDYVRTNFYPMEDTPENIVMANLLNEDGLLDEKTRIALNVKPSDIYLAAPKSVTAPKYAETRPSGPSLSDLFSVANVAAVPVTGSMEATPVGAMVPQPMLASPISTGVLNH